MINNKLVPVGFTWFDTGTLENYKETNENFSGGGKEFDFSKSNEFIYFVNGKVVKYFSEKDIVEKRIIRSNYLKGLCPVVESKKGNFYSYKMIDGQVLYDVLDRQIVRDFLRWLKVNLWKDINLSEEEKEKFRKSCKEFYYDKTLERLKRFYEKTRIEDSWSNVNGVQIPPLKELLNKIDWNYLEEGTPVNFHGDLQFDNVLVTRNNLSNLNKFILLDWRHEFGKSLDFGDLYYDLAKLYGGTNISYKSIKKGEFSFDISGDSIYYDYKISNNLIEAREEYESFLTKHGFDLDKIRIITALIFLNMSPLHQEPFNLMLYFMGKNKLYYALNNLEMKKDVKK